MKKVLITLCMICICVAVSAQGTFTKPDDGSVKYGLFDKKKRKKAAQEADQQKVNEVILGEKKAKEQKAKAEKSKVSKPVYNYDEEEEEVKRGLLDYSRESEIDPKYLAGACPELNGKIQWETIIDVPGMKARAMYDKMLKFLFGFVKEKGNTELSNVSVVNEEETQIGVRVQEWLVFENKPLSLDQTKFNYQLIFSCMDNKCRVVMRSLTYLYEEDRGGTMFPAEDMISDSEALNKTKTGFRKGGCKKFRTKTIDRKDQLFARFATVLNGN